MFHTFKYIYDTCTYISKEFCFEMLYYKTNVIFIYLLYVIKSVHKESDIDFPPGGKKYSWDIPFVEEMESKFCTERRFILQRVTAKFVSKLLMTKQKRFRLEVSYDSQWLSKHCDNWSCLTDTIQKLICSRYSGHIKHYKDKIHSRCTATSKW